MKYFYKVFSLFYTLFLKLLYFNRVKINGIIFIEGFVKITVEKGGKFILNGNLYLRSNTVISVRSGGLCIIDKNVFFNRNSTLICRKKIKIGERTLFGEYVKIYDHDHKFDVNKIYDREFVCKDIFVGKDCWIGNNVNILKGSYIPCNSIIGSMSLVNKNLKEAGIYVGIPVKCIKKRVCHEI